MVLNNSFRIRINNNNSNKNLFLIIMEGTIQEALQRIRMFRIYRINCLANRSNNNKCNLKIKWNSRIINWDKGISKEVYLNEFYLKMKLFLNPVIFGGIHYYYIRFSCFIVWSNTFNFHEVEFKVWLCWAVHDDLWKFQWSCLSINLKSKQDLHLLEVYLRQIPSQYNY